MLQRALDETYPAEVRRHITGLTLARTTANACFRFTPAFLATIAAGQGVSLDRIGIAVAISELSGLVSPAMGIVAERLHRRTAMWAGLLGVGLGTGLAAVSTNLVVFAIALVTIAQSKVLFDLGLAAWLSDRVPFDRRGRVIGLTETSWALGLLLGVTTMGLVTAATNWRVGYAVGAVAVVALAAYVSRVVEDDPAGQGHADRRAAGSGRMSRRGWVVMAGTFCLMSASQALFVTFSSWLKDHFGFTDTGISVVAFCLGFGELAASLSAAKFSDRWGKERSAAGGAAVMVPAALLLVVLHDHVALGLPLLLLAIVAFEFAIVSVIPVATETVPGSPAKGMAFSLGAGTVGRATMSGVATRVYVDHGMAWPAALCAVFATGTIVAMWRADVHHFRGFPPRQAAGPASETVPHGGAA
ncbi:MAG: MFS transporter [Ilumatobacteraceae bacterium]